MNKLLKLFIIHYSLFTILFTVHYSFAQSHKMDKDVENFLTIKGLQYGFNFGVYFPSNATANYYNGDPSHTLSLKRTILDTFNYIGPGYTVNYIHDSIAPG